MDLQRHMAWSFFMFIDLRGEVIVNFAAIGGIVDHNWVRVMVFNATFNSISVISWRLTITV
jgi:hypothetical protein